MEIDILEQKKEEKTKIEVPTFLKWAGGKRQLLEQFDKYFPNDIENYVEPFLGGGSVLFYILKYKKPKKVYAYDMNKDLINVFVQVRDNPKKLIELLKKYQDKHNNSENSKDNYYGEKINYNSKLRDKTKKAALFIYLNKTCYNGLYRVNSLGEFNVPFGKYDKINIFDEKKLLEANELLQKVTFDTSDFREINFSKNSVVYFDPPYWSESNGFTDYNKLEFGRNEQLQLNELYIKLHDEGQRVILSNSNTSFISGLYSKFNVHEVDARWMINCNGSARTKLKELLITNFRK